MATIGPQHAVNSLLKTLAIAAFPHEYRHRARDFKLEERQAFQNMPLFVLRDVVITCSVTLILVLNLSFCRLFFQRCLSVFMFLNSDTSI